MSFKELLKTKGATQAEVAKHLGISQQLVSGWVNNVCQPRLEMLPKLCDFFKVSVAEIVDCFKK